MNIELLRAYDAANRLRESGKNVPEYLLKRIKKLEKDLISWDLIPRIEDLFDYILEGYESPVSLKINFYPGSNEIIIDDLSPKEEKTAKKKETKPTASTNQKDKATAQIRPFNTYNQQHIVEPPFSQLPPAEKTKQKAINEETGEKDFSTHNEEKEENFDADVKVYLDDFMRMKRKSGGAGAKKAVMLLTMFKLIACGYSKTNELKFDDTLILMYNRLWEEYMPPKEKGTKDACKPFVQLIREPFYRVRLTEDKRSIEIDHDWNTKTVRDTIRCVSFDGMLFRLVQNKDSRVRMTEYLIDLFGLNQDVSFEEIKPSFQLPLKETIVNDIIIENEPITSFIFSFRVEEYDQNKVKNLKASALRGAVAIASNNKKKKSYVIYDTTLKPLSKVNLLRFLIKLMITRKLANYRFESNENVKIENTINMDVIESLLKCSVFQEVDFYSGDRNNYFLILHNSVTGFQIYTSFLNLTEKVYQGLNGNETPEFYSEFEEFLKVVKDQTFISVSTTKWG